MPLTRSKNYQPRPGHNPDPPAGGKPPPPPAPPPKPAARVDVTVKPPATEPEPEPASPELTQAAQQLHDEHTARATPKAPPNLSVNPLDKHVNAIVDAPDFFNVAHAARLVNALPAFLRRFEPAAETVDYEDINVSDELAANLLIVRRMRTNILNEDGTLKANKEVKDIKDLLSATTGLINLIMKSKEEIDKQARMRAVETAVQAAVDWTAAEFGIEALKEKFLEQLETELEKIE